MSHHKELQVVIEVDVDEVLDMGEEVFETIESQRKRDTMDRKDLEDQCVEMREATREAIDERESSWYAGELRAEEY